MYTFFVFVNNYLPRIFSFFSLYVVTNGGLKQNGSTSKSMIQIHEDPTKIEFHRLALVALPLDEKLTSTVKRTINRHTNGTDKGM